MDAIERLGEEIGELAARVDAATQRLLTCIRQFDLGNGWDRQGAISCAHWLAWRVGLDTATARERVRVARALGSLPHIDEAFGRGELSYAKVRAITRVATPSTEAKLLEMARQATGAQLERICRGVRQVRTAEALYAGGGPPPEDRAVRERLLPGGMIRLELVLSPDEAALVLKAVEKARDHLGQQAAAADTAGDVSVDTAGDGSAETAASPPSRADGIVALANRVSLTAESERHGRRRRSLPADRPPGSRRAGRRWRVGRHPRRRHARFRGNAPAHGLRRCCRFHAAG
jgi:hypothetical protein